MTHPQETDDRPDFAEPHLTLPPPVLATRRGPYGLFVVIGCAVIVLGLTHRFAYGLGLRAGIEGAQAIEDGLLDHAIEAGRTIDADFERDRRAEREAQGLPVVR